MKTRHLLVLLFSLLPALARADSFTASRELDVDAAAFTYHTCAVPALSPFRIKTTGSSTTVTAAVAGQNPFDTLGIGDHLLVKESPTTTTFRYITAKASGASVTVSGTAVDWENGGTGFQFDYRDCSSGTGDEDGWFNCAAYAERAIVVEYDQGDITLDVRWEVRGTQAGSSPQIAYPTVGSNCGLGGVLGATFCSYATPGVTARVTLAISSPTSQCRVGLKAAADASDAGTDLEQIDVFMEAEPIR